MEYKYPNLCKPITLGRTTFRNRMFSAPMGGTDITNDGCIGPKSTAFYELRAKGGAAAVIVSELMVHPSTDGSHAYHLDESIRRPHPPPRGHPQHRAVPLRHVLGHLHDRQEQAARYDPVGAFRLHPPRWGSSRGTHGGDDR